MSPKAIMVVLTDPKDESVEDEYNDWYTNTHLNDVLKVPGFVAATRYRLADEQPEGAPPASHRYLAVYEIDADDIGGALDELVARRPERYLSPALDASRTEANVFVPITERRTRQNGA